MQTTLESRHNDNHAARAFQAAEPARAADRVSGASRASLRTVLLLQSAGEAFHLRSGPAHYAVGLAQAFDSHLRALLLELDVALPGSGYGRWAGAEDQALIVKRNADARKEAQQLQLLAQESGLSVDLVTRRSYAYTVPEVAAEQARLHDIAVAGVRDSGLLSEQAIADYVLFQSGRPLIVVPDDHSTPFSCETVVVAWDFSRTAARAMSDALPFLRSAREVTLVTFEDDKQIDTGLKGDDVVAALGRRGIQARFEPAKLRGRPIAEAINGFVADQGAHLLVMGGYGHSSFREFILGGATKEIFGAPTVPTLLSH